MAAPVDASIDSETFDTPVAKLPDGPALLPIVGVTKPTVHENETIIGLVLSQSTRREDFFRIGHFYTTRSQVRSILGNMSQR